MRTDRRLALAAFCTDLALYLLMLSLPYRVLEYGASSLVLGLVPLLYAGPYSLVALGAGRVSDRWPRRGPIRAGLALAMLGAILLTQVDTLGAMLAAIPLVGIGLGFFWPSVQAGFSELLEGRDLHRLTRRFNISWSAGKGLGLLAGGALLGVVGAPGLAAIAAAVWLLAGLAVPPMARPGDHSNVVLQDTVHASPARRRAFLRSAWIANGVAFGVAATLNHHLPRLLLASGIEADGFGLFLGLVFFAQVFLFAVLGSQLGWRYRVAPLLVLQVVLMVAVIAVAHVRSIVALMFLAPVFGAALGFVYQSSLYYSLHAPRGRGRQAGVHEAVLGIAGATLPLIGGAVATSAGPVAPFYVAAAATCIVLILSSTWLSRAQRDGRVARDPINRAVRD